MNKLTILCDADDVIENLISCWVDDINRTYGTSVNPEEIKSWDVAKCFPMLTKEQVFSPIYNKTLWEKLEPIEGSVAGLQRLNQTDYLYIVTATNYQTCDSKIRRILEIFPFLCWEQFIIASNKQLVKGHVLIDDGIHNLIDGDYRRLLFDRPHNHDYDAEANGMKRVYTWPQIMGEIENIRKEVFDD